MFHWIWKKRYLKVLKQCRNPGRAASTDTITYIQPLLLSLSLLEHYFAVRAYNASTLSLGDSGLKNNEEGGEALLCSADSMNNASSCVDPLYRMFIFSQDPLVIYISGFITDFEAQHLISKACASHFLNNAEILSVASSNDIRIFETDGSQQRSPRFFPTAIPVCYSSFPRPDWTMYREARLILSRLCWGKQARAIAGRALCGWRSISGAYRLV